jgi:hypothetical protein
MQGFFFTKSPARCRASFLQKALSWYNMGDPFLDHLKWCSDEVAKWPAWKQEIFGGKAIGQHMQLVYSDSGVYWPNYEGPGSIFLAGPSPRSKGVKSWRPQAIDILRGQDFHGTVFIPEWENPIRPEDFVYEDQVEWEHEALSACSKIVFWIPRNLETMPAFTTNVEFGRFAHTGRIYYGRPDDAPGNRYLDWLFKKYHPQRKIHNDLRELLKEAGTWQFS